MAIPSSPLFIGREHETTCFIELLEHAIEVRHYLLVTGIPGIGKSHLLRKWSTQLGNFKRIFLDIPLDDSRQIINYIVSQLEEAELLKTKIEKMATFEDDYGDLPLFSTLSIEDGLISAQPNNFSNLNSITTQLNEIAAQHKLVLFIDANLSSLAEIREFHDFFLQKLEKVLIILASRHVRPILTPLHRNQVTYLQLQPFSQTETDQFLRQYGIDDINISSSLMGLTKSIPLLLSETVAFVENNNIDYEQIHSHVRLRLIGNILEEIEPVQFRQLFRTVSIMRKFNLEAVSKLSRSQNLSKLLDALRICSFIGNAGTWITIIPELQEFLASDIRSNSPRRFIELNQKALSYYNSLTPTLNSPVEKTIFLEKVYHQLCVDDGDNLNKVFERFTLAAKLLDWEFCQSVSSELHSFPFKTQVIKDWLAYSKYTLSRMKYDWSDAQQGFEDLLLSSSNSQIRAYAFTGLARTLLEVGTWTEASQVLERAISYNYVNHDLLLLLGKSFLLQHQWDNALEAFNRAIASYKNSDTVFQFDSHLGLADLFRAKGIWNTAQEHLDKALIKAEELQSLRLEAQVWYRYGKLYRGRHNWDLAIQHFQRSSNLFEECKDLFGQSQALHGLGNIYLRTGDFRNAQQIIEESLELKNSIDDNFGIAKSYNSLGHIYRLNGDIEVALEHYQKSLELFEAVKNRIKSSRVMCRIGMLYAQQMKFEEAVKYLEKSRYVRIGNRDQQGVSESLYELGSVQEQSGDYTSAKESYLASLRLADSSQSLTRQLAPLVGLSILAYRNREFLSEASEYASTARRVASKSKQYSLLSSLYSERAQNEMNLGHYEAASLCYAEAVCIALHEGDSLVITVLFDLIKMLEEVQNILNKDVAENLARRQIKFWLEQCDAPKTVTNFWEEIRNWNPYTLSALEFVQKLFSGSEGIKPQTKRLN